MGRIARFVVYSLAHRGHRSRSLGLPHTSPGRPPRDVFAVFVHVHQGLWLGRGVDRHTGFEVKRDDMDAPDEFGCCRRLALLEEMRSRHVQPTGITLGCMVVAFASTGGTEGAASSSTSTELLS